MMFLKVLLAMAVFFACFLSGMKIASQKLLWNDELFTQVQTIDSLGYTDILKADFPEGNLSPLFYLGQKALCQATGYRLPVDWKREFCIYEPRGQVLLRVLPVLYMSLAVAVIFFYFACRRSIAVGLVALAVTLSGFSVWAFLPEARPYSLWFLLCSLQGILFMEILERKEVAARWPWVLMVGVNVLLSLTIFFSALPLLATAAVLLGVERGRYLRGSFFLTAIPLAICVAYYMFAKRTYPALSEEPGGILMMVKAGGALLFSGALWTHQDLILSNVSSYWFGFIVAGAAFIGARCFPGRGAVVCGKNDLRVFQGLLAALALMLLMSVAVVAWFLGWQANGNFGVTERYFIFLTPFSILLIMAIIRAAWKAAKKDMWWRLSIVISVIGLVALTSLGTFIHLMKWGPFWSV